MASGVISVLLRHQRRTDGAECLSHPCETCIAAHHDRVLRFIREATAIEFVLPGFPGKSPNRQKVLGSLPDMAEKLALHFLNSVCENIREVYPHGARIIICSDGRVFSDIVGIRDSDITRYRAGLREVITHRRYAPIRLFGLDDVYPGFGHWATRAHLLRGYGERIEELRSRVRAEEELRNLHRGLVRILSEDADRSGKEGNRATPALDSERRGYGVLQRSRAWGRVIAERFPHAVRLSIHPQPCGSGKLGIRLLDATDDWITPWHGVAVDVAGRFTLMKRREAEELGARLVYVRGRPSHYVLSDTRDPGKSRSPLVA
jgi:pyoverdine/dityrosine biosynthesis protein Dit1